MAMEEHECDERSRYRALRQLKSVILSDNTLHTTQVWLLNSSGFFCRGESAAECVPSGQSVIHQPNAMQYRVSLDSGSQYGNPVSPASPR